MSALRRLLGAPGLWVAMALAHLGIAAALARPLALMIGAAIAPYSIDRPGGLLPMIAEVISGHPELGVALGVALIAGTVLAGALWLVAAGGVIDRLRRPQPTAATIAAALRFLPSMAVLGLYSVIPRGLALAGLRFDVLGLGWARALLVLVGWTLCTVALDLARAAVIRGDARRYHPTTLLQGFAAAVTRPTVWLRSALLSALGLALSLAIVALAARGFGGPSTTLWLVRLLAALGVGVSLWRIAVAVDAGER
ncbi:MAG: hypothetical protein H6710_01820 [Myxococcales bacterium]|nr:hypothetical protein [Myxococcales bacterium]MCB9702857.1 hypothetical protein [Myxococcales bacterium]